jgi:ABC-2 type transport system permease protein
MILTIVRILFLRLYNNPLELVLVFVMPVVFFSIFAAIFSNGIATGSDKKLRIGLVTASETTLSLELQSFLKSNSSLECNSLISSPPLSDDNKELAEIHQDAASISTLIADAQRSGRYDLIVRLPVDFPARLIDEENSTPCHVQLVTDGQNPLAVAMVTSVVKGFFAQKQASLKAEQLVKLHSQKVPITLSTPSGNKYFDPLQDPSKVFANNPSGDNAIIHAYGGSLVKGITGDINDRSIDSKNSDQNTIDFLNSSLVDKQAAKLAETVSISIENPQAANQENPRIAMYAAGIAVLFLLFSATGNAAALLEEAESGTLDRMLVGKVKLYHIIMGKWLGIFLLGCLQITVMFLWAELIFKIQLWQHLDGFAVMTLCTSAATASFAMLLATLCGSRAQLNAVSVVLILSMSAVGGSMIPRFVMSERMKEIGKWTFNAWALDGYQKVFWYQAPIGSLQLEVSVLLSSTIFLGILALMFSSRWKR